MYISLTRWALTMAVLGRSAFADRSTKTFHYRLIATGQSNATCSVFISSCSWGQWGRAKVALMQKRPQTEPRAASIIRKPVVKPIARASAHQVQGCVLYTWPRPLGMPYPSPRYPCTTLSSDLSLCSAVFYSGRPQTRHETTLPRLCLVLLGCHVVP